MYDFFIHDLHIINIFYGSSSSIIVDVLINKKAQSITYNVTNNHHVYSPLECTIYVHISMHTYCK